MVVEEDDWLMASPRGRLDGFAASLLSSSSPSFSSSVVTEVIIVDRLLAVLAKPPISGAGLVRLISEKWRWLDVVGLAGTAAAEVDATLSSPMMDTGRASGVVLPSCCCSWPNGFSMSVSGSRRETAPCEGEMGVSAVGG